LTSAGACGFGLYGLCTPAFPSLDSTCSPFCAAYPDLCTDPANITWRGNFAAPNGDYYTQFWTDLPGNLDNYLSCGECFELVMTQADGTDYAVGSVGYTPPIILEIVDSCPCDANPKWCCGSGVDHCGEVSNFKYGCPLPAGSHHMDLSDIAMARLQTGNATGGIGAGVIPMRYQRVPCPRIGNAHLYLQSGAGPYWWALTIVNTANLGAVVNVEVTFPNGTWVALTHSPDYTSSRPQERYGSWNPNQSDGPFTLPMSVRITDGAGVVLTSPNAITAWVNPNTALQSWYYIDLGVQF